MFRFECVQQLEKAKELWETLTPKKTIYDEWEFRFTFYKYYQPELFFYAGYIDNELIGVLPLQQEKEHDFLNFFGGDYMEDNRVLIREGREKYIPEFYEYIKSSGKKYVLQYITGEDEFTKNLPILDYKYILPLTEFNGYEDYLTQYFEGKELREFKRKMRNIETKQNIEVVLNKYEDLEYLFEFNVNRFKDHSMFNRPYRKEIFKDLLCLSFKPLITSYYIDNKIQAVSYALIYKDILESFNTGIAPEAPKNLREYIYLKKIDSAIQMKLSCFDSFVRSYGWKERWHFHKIPQYTFTQS